MRANGNHLQRTVIIQSAANSTPSANRREDEKEGQAAATINLDNPEKSVSRNHRYHHRQPDNPPPRFHHLIIVIFSLPFSVDSLLTTHGSQSRSKSVLARGVVIGHLHVERVARVAQVLGDEDRRLFADQQRRRVPVSPG